MRVAHRASLAHGGRTLGTGLTVDPSVSDFGDEGPGLIIRRSRLSFAYVILQTWPGAGLPHPA
jgi:hypothetical protein